MQVRFEVIDKETGVTHSERVDIKPVKGITAWMVKLLITGLLSSLSKK